MPLVLAGSLFSGIPVAAECLKDLQANQPETAPLQVLQKRAEAGSAASQLRLAEHYFNGTGGLEKDLSDAAGWYLKAARQGVPDAQYQLGIMYLEGLGVTNSSTDALDWIFKAAMGGHEDAGRVFNYLMENPEPLEC